MTDIHLGDTTDLASQTAWLRRLARRLVGDAHAAEDVVQETFLVALEKPPRSLSGEGAARAWLHGIARNIARTGRRSEARRTARETTYTGGKPQSSPGADEVVERAAQARRLIDAVLELDEPYRTAVLLAYEERLDAPAIADRTGVSPAAARKRISRGIEQLRARLGAGRGGRSSAWLVAFAGVGIQNTTTPLLWTTGFAMAVKWMATAAVVAALVGFGFWALRGAGDPVEADSISAGSAAREEQDRTDDLANVDPSSDRAGASIPGATSSQRSGDEQLNSISGRVLLTDGRSPVVGARVLIGPARSTGADALSPPEPIAESDSNGRFRFEVEKVISESLFEHGIWVRHDEVYDVHVDAAQISAQAGRVIEVRTVALGTVVVHVLDEQGQPASETAIEYTMKPTFGSDAQLWSHQGDRQAGSTDAYGDVVVEGLPVSTSIRFGIRGEYTKPARVVIDPVTRRAETTLRIRGWAQVVALLEWNDGSPAANVAIHWDGAPSKDGMMGGVSARTNEDGRVVIGGLSSGGGVVGFSSGAYHEPVHTRVERGETTDLGTLVVTRPAKVAGRVVLPQGRKVPSPLFVCAMRDGAIVAQVALDESAEFELEVPPGPVFIALSQGTRWDPTLPFSGSFLGTVAATAPDDDVELHLSSALGVIRGSVERSGTNAPTVRIVSRTARVRFGSPELLYGANFDPEFTAAGSFEMVTRPLSDVRFIVRNSDGRTAYSDQVSIAAGEDHDLGALHWSRGTATVRVTGALGEPVRDALVTMKDTRRTDTELRTNEQGLAAFELPVGPYGLRASAGDQLTGEWQLVHVEPDGNTEVQLSVGAAGILNGLVHSPNGPVADLPLRAQCMKPISNLSFAATTAVDGTFRFKDLMPGTYRVSAGNELIGNVILEPGVPSNLDLSIGGPRVAVEVVAGGDASTWVKRLAVSPLGDGLPVWRRGVARSPGLFEVDLPGGPLQFMLDLNGLGNNQQLLVTGPAKEGTTYRLELPRTGIELRIEGGLAHAPIPAAFLETLDGTPAWTYWGASPEVYAEDKGVDADGVRIVRFPFIDANAQVRIEGLDSRGETRKEVVQIAASGMTRVRWD